MKTDLRVAVTKRMIQEALLRLLESKPLEKIKINELCLESGVNRATFYRHYETLQEVLREIEIDFIQGMPRLEIKPRSIEEVRSHMEMLCNFMYDHSNLVRLLFQNRSDEDLMQSMTEVYRDFLSTRKGQTTLPQLDEDTVQILIALLGGGCHCLMRKWIMGGIHKTPGELAQILCDAFGDHTLLGFM